LKSYDDRIISLIFCQWSILTSGGVQVVPTAAEVATATVSIPTGSGVVPTVSPTIPTASPIFTTATESTPYIRKKGKETMVESETPKKKKVQEQIDVQLARELEEEMVRVAQRMNEQIARDAKIARIHAEEELHMLIDELDRNNETVAKEELNQLWILVKETLNIRPAVNIKEKEHRVELKRLYEPDVEDLLWTHSQNLMHALIEWKLYDTCRVHHVISKDQDIFMLVEKDYPLRKGLAIVMISYKLQRLLSATITLSNKVKDPISGNIKWYQSLYLQHEHYALWEVIEFGDSYKAPDDIVATGSATEGTGKKKGRTVAFTTEDMQKRKNDVKARPTLLLALLDEHQLRFKGSETLEQTFNRLQVIVSHLQFMDIEIKQDDLNQKFLTSLAPEWLMHIIVWRIRSDLDTISLDDLYNHLKTGKKISIQGTDVARFDKSKLECFNCHKMSHFSRECRAPKSQDKGRRDNYRQRSKVEEQAPKALMTIDGVGWDWSFMANEEEDHALATDSPTKNKADKVETVRKTTVKYVELYRKTSKKANVRGNQRNWNNLKSQQLGKIFVMKKACYNCGTVDHLSYNCRKWVDQGRSWAKNNNTHKSRSPIHKPNRSPMRTNKSYMNAAQPKRTSFYKPAHSYHKRPFQRASAVRSQFRGPRVPTVNRKFPTVSRKFCTGNSRFSTTDQGNKGKAVKALVDWIWKPSQNLSNKGLNSNSVSVMFKKYTYIDTQGRLNGCSRYMTGNISYLSDYEPYDGGYVSSRQGGCKITGKGTIKTDDTNVLLRTPRQHNMYTIDLNNIVPHKDLTCLVAKAFADECMLWHRRLGHLNFKTMNKLVRNNLVRGLPTKCFENDHNCTVCLKGKQHKASCKTKLVNSMTKPLHTLHMDLFGPLSLNHKWYCLVVTDDFSRFTWTFFLKTKDETSGILRNFITKIENLKELRVKIIKCDNRGEFRNKEMNDFCSKKEGLETLEQTFNRLQVIVGQLQFIDIEIEQDDLNQKFLTSLASEWLMHTISSGSQIRFEDINQIDEDDIEEMDIKWKMALLSMRADKAPGNQDRGRRDNYRQGSKAEEQAPKDLMAIDGVGWDWSYMANDEEDHALVADEDLDNLIESQRSDIIKDGLGYSAVPPPPAQLYLSPKKDLSWTCLPECADDTVTDYSRPSPTVKSILGDDQNINPFVFETVASPITPKPFINQSKSKTGKTESPKKPPVKYAEQYRKPIKKPNVRGNQRNLNNFKFHQLGPDFVMKKKACFNYGDFNHLAYGCRKMVKKSFTPKPVVHRPFRPSQRPVKTNMNGARPNKTFFNKQAHSYANRPFPKTSAVRSPHRAPWVPTANRNFPPVNRKFSPGSRNFPTTNRKLPTASRKFPTGSTNCSTADMGMKGKDVKPSAYWFWKPSQNLSNKVVVAGTNSTNFSGTKEAACQDVKKDVSSLRYIVLPNWFHETYLKTSTSNAQDAFNTNAFESSGNSNLTATLTNPLVDQMETLAVETLILTVSSPVPTACLNDSLESSSDTRLISKRVTSQDDTPSLDNILTLTNKFEDILGVTTNTDDTHKVEADLGNMETTITASFTPTLRIHNDHPKSQIIGPVNTLIQTRNKSKEMEEQIYHMDVKSAFLYDTIDEEVYVMQPLGFQDPEFPARVYKVEKAILQVLQKEDGIFLSQDKYVGDILKKFRYPDVRSSNTPMDKENPWGKDETGKDVDLHLYRSMIGSLMYLTASRPDIMFAICACSRHQVTSKECHLHAVKRIFRYLKGHPKLGLWYPKESPFDLVAYSDSDYGGATQDHKSTTGGC
nr:hypothetical protein [Tanacetum cinerariifolium]